MTLRKLDEGHQQQFTNDNVCADILHKREFLIFRKSHCKGFLMRHLGGHFSEQG